MSLQRVASGLGSAVFTVVQELAGKSFIRSPNYNLVRIGICKDGIYKLDSASSKVLAHWRFKDVRDSSYSGFSFTLVSVPNWSCDHVTVGWGRATAIQRWKVRLQRENG